MRKIYKYPLDLDPTKPQEIVLPYDPKMLSCGVDPTGTPVFWVAVHASSPDKAVYEFATVWTGQEVPAGAWEYLGTPQHDSLVYHVLYRFARRTG